MNGLRQAARTATFAVSALGAALGPWLDLAIRLWLAQAFLVVQVREMMASPSSGPSAPLGPSWWLGALHGVMASGPGAAFQGACPVLLAVGLLCRPVAPAMLA